MNRKLLLFVTLFILLSVSLWFIPERLGLAELVDRTPPILAVETRTSPKLGVWISAEDSLAGIESVQIVLQGESESAPIEQKGLGGEKHYKRAISIAPLLKGKKDGTASLRISVTDNSFWSNTTTADLQITLDRIPPTLEVLSQQHRMYGGGVELVVYRTADAHLRRSGIALGEDIFIGQPLNKLYPESNADPELHAVLFAAPLGLTEDEFNPTLFADDAFNNSATIPLSFTFAEKKIPAGTPKLSDRFLQRKIPPLINEASQLYPAQFESFGDGVTEEAEWIGLFRKVNEDFRTLLRSELQDRLDQQASTPFYPSAPLIRPMGGRLMSGFGEHRRYSWNGQDAGESIHEGFDLASVKHDAVRAAGAGTVLFAKSFGIYGKAVLIDHGLGLSSLYGHLSSLRVAEGDLVAEGQELGRSGETGLAGGDHLHFEIRVGFVPVTPIEWWDQKWFKDNVTAKLAPFIEG